MRHITSENAAELNARLSQLNEDKIVAFPNDETDRVVLLDAPVTTPRVRGWRRNHSGLLDPRQRLMTESFKPARVIEDWHALQKYPYPYTNDDVLPRIDAYNARRPGLETYAAYFNYLLDTAAGQQWLLGFGNAPLINRDEEYDPPATPTFYRLTAPESSQSEWGQRETLGEALAPEDALANSVHLLGHTAVEASD